LTLTCSSGWHGTRSATDGLAPAARIDRVLRINQALIYRRSIMYRGSICRTSMTYALETSSRSALVPLAQRVSEERRGDTLQADLYARHAREGRRLLVAFAAYCAQSCIRAVS